VVEEAQLGRCRVPADPARRLEGRVETRVDAAQDDVFAVRVEGGDEGGAAGAELYLERPDAARG
jgi:hypothetical protein